jgi:hypothetical protein
MAKGLSKQEDENKAKVDISTITICNFGRLDPEIEFMFQLRDS